MPACPPVSPHEGASIGNRRASCAMHNHFYAWKSLLCGWGTCPLRMKTPLRGRSGGHTGAAPTISRMAPCSKVAGEQFDDGLNRKRLPANSSPMDKIEKRLPPNSSPMDKIENDCWRTVRRWTNTRNVCRRTVCRWTKSKKGCCRTVCRRTKSRKGCWRTVRRRTKSKKVAGE